MIHINRTQIFTWMVAFLLLFVLVFPSAQPSIAAPIIADPALPNVKPAIRAAPAPLSVTPNFINIPLTDNTISVDGFCDFQAEYGKANVETFTDGNGKTSTIYLVATVNNLYICMQAQPGTFSGRNGTVYLDPQGDGSSTTYAQNTDDAFQVDIPGVTRTSYHGNGAPGGWKVNGSLDPSWNGKSTVASTNGTYDTVEFSLLLQDLGLSASNCSLFGLSVFHNSVSAAGDDYGWPAGAIFDQPRTWQLARIQSATCASGGDIAYVFQGNTADAISLYNLITPTGHPVDLIPLSSVLATDFSPYKLILIANDTGYLNNWGTPPALTVGDLQVAKIKAAKVPIIGLGEGGYAFFGRLSLYIGWPQGWHGPQNVMNDAITAPVGFFSPPTPPVTHYTAPTNSVGIYLNKVPAGVTPVGLEDPPANNHSSLILQGCRLLWGNSGNPLGMTANGATLFLNSLTYMLGHACPTDATIDPACLSISKAANGLPTGTPVSPGQLITYTITYLFSDTPGCGNPGSAKLIDFVPPNTSFVPGSATSGATPAGDGSLIWTINTAPATQTISFQVSVSDTLCALPTTSITNTATLLVSGFAPIVSTPDIHPANCPAISFPSHSPFYAEDEIQVDPYPLLAGHPSSVTISMQNNTTSSQPVTVQFQTSPSGLGTGLAYTTFDTRSANIPGSSSLILASSYTPAASGPACFQITVTGPGLSQPLKTQSCIDNSEDFSGSHTSNDLIFPVGNPTASSADVILVVDNTCPGWSAAFTDPASGVIANLAGNDTALVNVTLQVTRPNPAPAELGSGCHIDVQEWIGSQLVGGIRKVDIPPVHLPTNITPLWEEPEVTFNPDPPVAGVPGQVCIALGNPLSNPVDVTVEFDAADFGAGIGFVPIGTADFHLPANSYDHYCIPWTPPTTGTLHRCILVKLNQANYREIHSQHNIDIVRAATGIGSLDIPVTIGNPDLVDHVLTFGLTPSGIDPFWTPTIVTPLGDPPPSVIHPGDRLSLRLRFNPLSTMAVQTAPPIFHFGDVTQVSVAVLFDGLPANGFTVQVQSYNIFLPILHR